MNSEMEVIARMMTPRPYWGTSYILDKNDMRVWQERLDNEAVTLTAYFIDVPTDIENKTYTAGLGHRQSAEDRERILDVLNYQHPERLYEVKRDNQLQYPHSECVGEILFTSNVPLYRINSLVDHHKVKKFGWSHLQENNNRLYVIINHAKLTQSQCDKEREERIVDRLEMIERANRIMREMF